MKQKEMIERMQTIARQLQRGMISAHECETAMNNIILEGLLQYPSETSEQVDKRLALMKKMKRRMWRILLEATK